VGLAATLALAALWACDQEYPTGGYDVSIDPGYDPGTDIGADPGTDPGVDPGTDPGVDPGTDPGVDPGTDPGVDPGTDPGTDTGPCTYPAGPYAYTRIGDTVGPASWPTAIKASGETFPSATGDFNDLYCDPNVHSIVIFLSTRS
jgi:hypothetical protein